MNPFIQNLLENAFTIGIRIDGFRARAMGRLTVRRERRIRKGFESRLARRYREALFAMDRFMLETRESGVQHHSKTRIAAEADQDQLYVALVRLHARSCLVATEIRALIYSGHASGAIARWRTLHELTVTAQFLKKHGEEAARLYLEHAALVTSKRARDYRNYQERLSLEPIDDDELLEHESHFQQLLDRYGKAFTTDYGWAAVVLETKRAEFSSIERDVELDHWRPYYRMASDSIHAGFRGSQYDLGFGQFPPEVMLAGPSNAGLVEPAQFMILDLNLCTITFLSYRPTPRTAMRIHVLNDLALDARDKFLEADNKLKYDEESLRSLATEEDV